MGYGGKCRVQTLRSLPLCDKLGRIPASRREKKKERKVRSI